MLLSMVVAGSASPVAAGYCSGNSVSGDDIDVANSGGNVVIDNDDDDHHGHYYGDHYHDYDDGLIDIL